MTVSYRWRWGKKYFGVGGRFVIGENRRERVATGTRMAGVFAWSFAGFKQHPLSRRDGAESFLWLLALFKPGEARAEIFESVLVGASDVGEAANVLGVDLELRSLRGCGRAQFLSACAQFLRACAQFLRAGVKFLRTRVKFLHARVERFRGLQQELQPSVDVAVWRIRIGAHVFRVHQSTA